MNCEGHSCAIIILVRIASAFLLLMEHYPLVHIQGIIRASLIMSSRI